MTRNNYCDVPNKEVLHFHRFANSNSLQRFTLSSAFSGLCSSYSTYETPRKGIINATRGNSSLRVLLVGHRSVWINYLRCHSSWTLANWDCLCQGKLSFSVRWEMCAIALVLRSSERPQQIKYHHWGAKAFLQHWIDRKIPKGVGLPHGRFNRLPMNLEMLFSLKNH